MRRSRGSAVLPGCGGLMAERVGVEREIDGIVERLTDLVFAFLGAWKDARHRAWKRQRFAEVNRDVKCGFVRIPPRHSMTWSTPRTWRW